MIQRHYDCSAVSEASFKWGRIYEMPFLLYRVWFMLRMRLRNRNWYNQADLVVIQRN